MNKLILHILPVLMLILTITSSHASNLQLPATGQTITQAAGDDGAVQAGKAWPVPRFADNRNGTIGDNLTGLVWSGDANPLSGNPTGNGSRGEITWQKALEEIKRMNAEEYLGFSDWRLPNLNELASLVHQGEAVQSTWLSRQGFSNTGAARYWCSSSVARDAARAWTVHLESGTVGSLQKNGSALVWPVRGGASLLPATGQIACYNSAGLSTTCSGTGQDGELRMGAPWPELRFSDNENGTITDNLTGLVWPQNANPAMDARIARASDGSALWPDALEFVAGLNRTSYLGHSDWRLPNRVELVSLVNYAETTPGVQLNMAGVGDIQERYWSSGSSATNPSDAWNIAMKGEVLESGKYDPRFGSYIWPVRGGIEALTASPQSDGTQTKTLVKTVAAVVATLSVTTTALPAGMTGTAYSQTLGATGGTTPYTWTRTTGTLPAGLTLSTTGVISGTPTTAGTGTFTVQVKDKVAKTATKSLSIIVNPAPLSITTAALADGYRTTAYSLTLAATGGKTAYTWSIPSGTLPAGLTLTASTGKISGTATATGSSTVTVQVKDANNTIVSKPLTISIYALPAITTASLPAASIGTAYSQTLAVSGGKAPYTWTKSAGTLPAGLILNASTGAISGTPTTAGTSSVTFKVTDANSKTATKTLSITVTSAPLTITSNAMLPDAYTGNMYWGSPPQTVSGGKSPYAWSVSGGSLPVSLILDTVTGSITGYTSATQGSYSFTLQVTDSNNSIATKPFSMIVYASPSILTHELPDAYSGENYSQSVTGSGGKQPYTWSIINGSLPDGLSLNPATGLITGLPATPGISAVTIELRDTNTYGSNGQFTLRVAQPLSVDTSTLPDIYINTPYNQALSASGGKPPYLWSIPSENLPVGLTLDSATGIINGTPTTAGASALTIQVRDSGNRVVSKVIGLAVKAFGTIGGIVSDQNSATPMQGVTVMLNLSYKGSNPSDKAYSCQNTPFSVLDYSSVESDDEIKFSCYGDYISYFQTRNPFGVPDPFIIRWKGLSAYSGEEYLAQSFKPTKTGALNRVSFYFSGYSAIYSPSQGGVYVLLKSSLGGDRGIYLAHSAKVAVSASTAPGWYDFDFVTPVTVTAGQEYFIELQGSYPTWEFMSGSTYYDSASWGNDVPYSDGRSYQRVGGIWGQLANSLAFRTYVDATSDIVTPLPTQGKKMHGTASYAPYIFLINPTTNLWESCTIDYANSNGFYTDNNSSNFSCSKAVSSGSGYYDQNGWITAVLYSSSSESPATNAVTDQFSLTFNRTLTAVTDTTGAFSFPNLPDGNFTVTYGGTKTSSGILNPGQVLNMDSQLPSVPPMAVNFTFPSDHTLISSSGTIAVSGTISSNGTVSINGVPATVANNAFSTVVGLTEGVNAITATGTNMYGQTASSTITVIYNSAPRIVAAPATLNFGAVKIGAAVTLNIAVSNTSADNLLLGMITRPPAPFWIVSDDCTGSTLAPAASCRITTQFIPTEWGTFTNELAIPLDEATQQHLAITLQGSTQAFNGYYLPDTGQAGDAARNALSYTVNSDKVVTDNNTGLMWERDGSAAGMTWTDAGAYCTTLVKDGYSGWRLPTFLELDTIVHYGYSNPSIDQQTFPSARAAYYWTSSADADYPGSMAKSMDFSYGNSQSQLITSSAYTRCVRGAPLFQNGTVFEGDPKNPDNGGILADQDSGLIWMSKSSIPVDGWNGAMNTCPSISYGGKTDWRVPTIKELATLTTPTCTGDDYCYPWASTRSNLPDGAGQITKVFAGGAASDIVITGKTSRLPLRCVRGGNVALRDSRQITVSPPVLDFGYPQFGNSADRSVTIANTGSGDLTVGSIPAAVEPFAIVSDTCSGRTLPGGGLCTVTLRFSSNAAGPYSASFTIPSNDADAPNVTVPMIGTAALPDTALSGKATDLAGTPIAGVTVAVTDLSNMTQEAITNAAGNYLFATPPTGAFIGTMTKPGYSSFVFSGALVPQQKLTINGIVSPILPLISDVITEPTTTTALIRWATDQAADSSVEFGESGEYGSITADPALTTEHAVTLTGLKPLTTYHFRVVSTNGYGVSTITADQTFSTPLFSVRNLGDSGNVSVMEATGNYDARNQDGTFNYQPRKAIAAEYFKTHSDVDFLVYLSTFDYTMPDPIAQGFYSRVKNDTLGINQPVLNNTAQYGSQGMLQGTIDMGNVSALGANPFGSELGKTVNILNHEVMHRFGSYVRYKNPDGTLNSGLLGKEDAHWSYLLDSDGSFMFGNDWKNNGDGTFTTTSVRYGYSPLDLYLMGMIDRSQVPPILLIDNPAIDRNLMTFLGATTTISGTAQTVTIDDIIAAEGERIPNVTNSQKSFTVGFVLLTRAGDNAAAAIQAAETVRKAWAGEFAQLTQGKGSIANIHASLELHLDSPSDGATIIGPDVNVSGSFINSTGAETGVVVNGIVATVNGSSFIANHVPLQEGANTITITATDANGLTATSTRSVTAQAGHYIRITSNIESGTGPLDLSFRLDGSFTPTTPQISYTGPAAVTLTPGVAVSEFSTQLTVEGTYTFTASEVGPDGQTYLDSMTVTVVNRWQLDNQLRAKWENMRTALATGDVATAVTNFNPFTMEIYREQFTSLSASLPTIAAGMGNIMLVKVEDDQVEYDMRDTINGTEYTFYLLFVKGGDGIWKIRNF